MRNKWFSGIPVLILFTFIIVSCKTGNDKKTVTAEVKIKTEADLLMEALVAKGDYVNSRQFPSMIKAPTLYESLDSSTLVIDLREPDAFAKDILKVQ